METAEPTRAKEIMDKTFVERRVWVTAEKGPQIKDVMVKYPSFHQDLSQVTTISEFQGAKLNFV